MQIYELIQELAQYNATDDVYFKVETTVEGKCDSCNNYIDVDLDREMDFDSSYKRTYGNKYVIITLS